jgi:hypothetical protein
MSPVVIATPLTEGLPAAPRAAIRADRRSTVGTFRHSAIATGHTYVAVACSVFDLTGLVHGKSTEYHRSSVQSSRPKFCLSNSREGQSVHNIATVENKTIDLPAIELRGSVLKHFWICRRYLGEIQRLQRSNEIHPRLHI